MVNNYNKISTALTNSVQGNGQIDNIMLQFQQSMQQMANSFMETQQRVMLAYLTNQKGETYLGEHSAQVLPPGIQTVNPNSLTEDAGTALTAGSNSNEQNFSRRSDCI